MKIRFRQMVAAPSWQIPVGAVISILKLSPEQERWLKDGVIELVADESEVPEAADYQETPERPFVPRLFPNSLIVCLGGGPSLTQEDVDYCRHRATAVIAINDAYRLAPWADVLYAADAAWWRYHWNKVTKEIETRRYSITSVDMQLPDTDKVTGRSKTVTHLLNTGQTGLELKPTGLRTGKNSGYQAINLAMHLGATTVVLLGYDMHRMDGKKSHWFGEHPNPLNRDSRYWEFIECYETLKAPLKKAGVAVINCTPGSALQTFPQEPLETIFPGREAPFQQPVTV